MSVLIKGVKLPKSCFGCHLFKLDDRDLWCIANHYAGCCRALSKYIDENKFVIERHPDCPLIEVPPHGRLIDADFEEQHYTSMTTHPTPDVTEQDRRNSLIIVEALQMAKTVIEAEE